MVVVIPKGGGTDFWEIELVEVLWKAISGIINLRISYSIQFLMFRMVLCGERDGDRHPRGKATSEDHRHEGDVPPCHIHQPAQGI